MTRAKPVAPTGATFTTSIARAAMRAVASFLNVLKNRRQVTRLAQLDDRLLKDIGLVRSDIDAALLAPITCDPSHHLSEVSGHRCLGKSHKPAIVQVSRVEMSRLRRPNAVIAPFASLP